MHSTKRIKDAKNITARLPKTTAPQKYNILFSSLWLAAVLLINASPMVLANGKLFKTNPQCKHLILLKFFSFFCQITYWMYDTPDKTFHISMGYGYGRWLVRSYFNQLERTVFKMDQLICRWSEVEQMQLICNVATAASLIRGASRFITETLP